MFCVTHLTIFKGLISKGLISKGLISKGLISRGIYKYFSKVVLRSCMDRFVRVARLRYRFSLSWF